MRNNSANDIKDRFVEEQKNIEEYLRFLEYKISVLNSDLQKIEQLLEKHKILKTGHRSYHLLLQDDKVKKEEIRYREIAKNKAKIGTRLIEINNKLEKTSYPEKLNTVDIRTKLGELILAIKEKIQENNRTDFKAIRQEFVERLKPHEKELRLDLYCIKSIENIESAVNYAIESANYLILKEELDDLLFIVGSLKHIGIMIKMSSKDEQLSIVRQGFILFMTVFDATIFDLMRIALNKNFFKLIGFFGKNDKISLDTLNNYNTFDDLKNSLIEKQLKKKYIKDVLLILEKINVNLTEDKKKDDLAKLVELILRRNVHIHNRGIVDERYLDKNIEGIPQFDVYGFKLDDYARIDNKYWKEAIRLSKNCVAGITDWIENKNCIVSVAT